MFIFTIRLLLIILFILYIIWIVRGIIKKFDGIPKKPKPPKDEFSEAYKIMNDCIEAGVEVPQHIKDIVNHGW